MRVEGLPLQFILAMELFSGDAGDMQVTQPEL